MKTLTSASIAVSVLLLGPPAAGAQGLDLTGSWAMQLQAFLPRTEAAAAPDCTFQGTANVAQTGSQLSGDIGVDLASGSNCPSTMSATLTGQVTGVLGFFDDDGVPHRVLHHFRPACLRLVSGERRFS
jgi:hypothetical protein